MEISASNTQKCVFLRGLLRQFRPQNTQAQNTYFVGRCSIHSKGNVPLPLPLETIHCGSLNNLLWLIAVWTNSLWPCDTGNPFNQPCTWAQFSMCSCARVFRTVYKCAQLSNRGEGFPSPPFEQASSLTFVHWKFHVSAIAPHQWMHFLNVTPRRESQREISVCNHDNFVYLHRTGWNNVCSYVLRTPAKPISRHLIRTYYCGL